MGKDIGRNDPCPCGSGNKYKYCCLNKNENTKQAEPFAGMENVIRFPGAMSGGDDRKKSPEDPAEEASAALSRQNFARARKKLEEALDKQAPRPELWNNMALVEQAEGEFEKMLEYIQRSLGIDPDNLFAHCLCLVAYDRLNRKEEVDKHLERAQKLVFEQQFPAEHRTKLLESLVATERYEEATSLYERLQKKKLKFKEDFIVNYSLGISYANQDEFDQAEKRWKEASRQEGKTRATQFLLLSLRLMRKGKIPQFEFKFDLWPGTGESIFSEGFEDFEENITRPMLVYSIWKTPGDLPEKLVGSLVFAEDPWVDDFLFSILKLPELTDGVKIQAAHALVDRGEIKPWDEIEIHINGKLKKINLQRETQVPEEAADKFYRALELKQKQKFEEAEKIYLELIAEEEDVPEFHMNLANVYRSTNRLDKAEKHMDRAMELGGPIRCYLNRVGLYLQQGEIEEARYLLDKIDFEVMTEDEDRMLFAWLKGEIEKNDENYSEAERWLERALEINPDHPVISEHLEDVRMLVSLEDNNLLESFAEEQREGRQEKHDKYLSVTVEQKTSLKELLANHVKDRLTGTARYFQIKNYGDYRKSELAEKLANYIQQNCADIINNELKPEEKECLRWLVSMDGEIPYGELVEKFGAETEDSVYWYYNQPDSIPGRLQFFGLLHTGIRAGTEKQVGLVPENLLARIRELNI